MRAPKALISGLLALVLVTAGCGDDTDVGTGGGTSTTAVPDREPDLVGTITSVTPFVPVTEDCTPPEDLDPDDPVSSDDPPVCTSEDNDVVGTILVEEDPDDPQGGRKISYTVTTDSVIVGADGFDGLTEGQVADTWVTGGMCAESYPEQCGLEAIQVH
jgi:hypothetical protein